jgi:hypothetical protein
MSALAILSYDRVLAPAAGDDAAPTSVAAEVSRRGRPLQAADRY